MCLSDKMEIRREHPDPDNSYSGFPQTDHEMLQTLVDAHDKFKIEMKKYLDMINPLHPADTVTLTSNQEEPKNSLLQHPTSCNKPHLDPNRIKLLTDNLPKLLITPITAAFETFIDQIRLQLIDIIFLSTTITKSYFTEWLNSRLSGNTFTDQSDKDFFEGYLSQDMTKVDSKSLWSKVSEKLTCDSQSQKSMYLTQTILEYKKKKLKEKFIINPRLHDLCKSIVAIIQESIKQSLEQCSIRLGKSKLSPTSSELYFMNKSISHSTQHRTSEPTQNNTNGSKSKTCDLQKDRPIPMDDNKDKIKNKLRELMTLIINDQQESWQIWTQQEGKTSAQGVRQLSYGGVAHMSNCTYGIRNLQAHGVTNRTIEKGILSKKHRPENASDFDIEVIGINQSDKSYLSIKNHLEEHIFNWLNEAREKGREMNVDYCLFCTTHSFYIYLAATMSKICACVAYSLYDKQLLENTATLDGLDIATIQRWLQEANWPESMDYDFHDGQLLQEAASKPGGQDTKKILQEALLPECTDSDFCHKR